jgi:hypothetical protein
MGHLPVTSKFRDAVKSLTSSEQRLRFCDPFETCCRKAFELELIETSFLKGIQALLESSDEQNNIFKGEVYLVGGGPGDPDLLTFAH